MARKAKVLAVGSGLPPGFKSAAVEGSFGQIHDFDKVPTLTGICMSFKTVNKGKKTENQVMTVKTSDGSLHALWNSYQLSGLFVNPTIGKMIYVSYMGLQKLKGRKSMKLFEVGVK